MRHRLVMSRRLTSVVLLAAAAPLFVACGGDDEPEAGSSSSSSSSSSSPAGSSSSESPSPGASESSVSSESSESSGPALADDFSPELAATDTILVYCIPGLPGSPRESCDLGHIAESITDMTGEMAEAIDTAPDPTAYADVSTAINDLTTAAEDVSHCDTWYAEGGGPDDPTCYQAWDSLITNWDALKTALDWPRSPDHPTESGPHPEQP